MSLSHLGFFFPEDCSHIGLSSSDELLEVEDPITCEPEAGVPTTGEPCDPEALYGEPVSYNPNPVPKDPAG